MWVLASVVQHLGHMYKGALEHEAGDERPVSVVVAPEGSDTAQDIGVDYSVDVVSSRSIEQATQPHIGSRVRGVQEVGQLAGKLAVLIDSGICTMGQDHVGIGLEGLDAQAQ
jgi:hypothetical protein